MKKQHEAPVNEHMWDSIKPKTGPNIGPDKIARKAVPGIPND